MCNYDHLAATTVAISTVATLVKGKMENLIGQENLLFRRVSRIYPSFQRSTRQMVGVARQFALVRREKTRRLASRTSHAI